MCRLVLSNSENRTGKGSWLGWMANLKPHLWKTRKESVNSLLSVMQSSREEFSIVRPSGFKHLEG